MARYKAVDIAKTLAEILGDIGYRCSSTVRGSSPVYSVGGCGCGCAPDFQIVYDRRRLAIVPPIIGRGNSAVLAQKREDITDEVLAQYPDLKSIHILCKGDSWPKFMEKHRRR